MCAMFPGSKSAGSRTDPGRRCRAGSARRPLHSRDAFAAEHCRLPDLPAVLLLRRLRRCRAAPREPGPHRASRGAGAALHPARRVGLRLAAVRRPALGALPTRAFAPVPASWNDARRRRQAARAETAGAATCCGSNCPRGQHARGGGRGPAHRLAPVRQRRTGGGARRARARRRQASRAAVHSRIPISREFACPLRITLHVSNFDHRAGGFVRPLAAGAGRRAGARTANRA